MPTTITGNTGVSQVQAGATSDGLPMFQCRAWVNFDGTRDSTGAASTANTARFIRASGNVSSVVRNGTGEYTVNFTTAMPDENYTVVFGNTSGKIATNVAQIVIEAGGAAGTPLTYTTTAVRISVPNNSGAGVDVSYGNIVIFR